LKSSTVGAAQRIIFARSASGARACGARKDRFQTLLWPDFAAHDPLRSSGFEIEEPNILTAQRFKFETRHCIILNICIDDKLRIHLKYDRGKLLSFSKLSKICGGPNWVLNVF
jgi:hypothetical protein